MNGFLKNLVHLLPILLLKLGQKLLASTRDSIDPKAAL
jgi:hypothetical protein